MPCLCQWRAHTVCSFTTTHMVMEPVGTFTPQAHTYICIHAHAGIVQEHACAMRHSLAQYQRQADSATESKLHEHVFQAYQLKVVRLRIGASPDTTEVADTMQQSGSPASADRCAHISADLLVSCFSQCRAVNHKLWQLDAVAAAVAATVCVMVHSCCWVCQSGIL